MTNADLLPIVLAAPGGALAYATLDYFNDHPERIGPRERRLILDAEAHLAGILATANPFAKAEPVREPGKRGGKFYTTARGMIRYGVKPAPRLPALPDVTLADLEGGTDRGYAAVTAATGHLVHENITHNRALGLRWADVKQVAATALEHVKEKLDLRKTARELIELGREHGPAFLAYAIAIEVAEDVVLPIILTMIGKPWLIPFVLAWHSEPFMYPLYFFVAKRIKGRRAMSRAEFHKALVRKGLQLGLFPGRIKHAPQNYLGTDKVGRPHWLAPQEAPTSGKVWRTAPWIRALGWQRVDDGSHGKVGARWVHRNGWRLEHCGHPTANWPWALYDPKGELILTGAKHSGDPRNGTAWPSLAEAMGYVATVPDVAPTLFPVPPTLSAGARRVLERLQAGPATSKEVSDAAQPPTIPYKPYPGHREAWRDELDANGYPTEIIAVHPHEGSATFALVPQPTPAARPHPDSPLVVAYGAGVDSTAMLVEMHNRGIRPDAILFADTMAEKPETYAYLPVMQEWLARVGFPPITIVRYVPPEAPYDSLEGNCLTNETLPSLAFGWHSCSDKWKQGPQSQWINRWDTARDAWDRGRPVLRAIGYDDSTRDNERAAHARTFVAKKPDDRNAYWYPLQDWHIDRERAAAVIAEAGLPVPMKSSCWFCPAMKKPEIEWLEREHPELIARAVAMEKGFLEGKHGSRSTKGLGRRFAWGEWLSQAPEDRYKRKPRRAVVKSQGVLFTPEVKSPGARGGRWFRRRRSGRIAYGEPPQSRLYGSVWLTPEGRIHAGPTPTHERGLEDVKQFRSGSSGVTEFVGFSEGNVPVGVQVMDTSAGVRQRIADYVNRGGEVFVDSGAFPAFRRGERVDFSVVFARYREILDKVRPDARARIYLVAPDVIGDQAASLAALATHASDVRQWIDDGITVLVPIQRGVLPPSVAYGEARRILEDRPFAVSIPSKAAAMPDAALAELLNGARAQGAPIRKLHLLGAVSGDEWRHRVEVIRQVEPDAAISSDGMMLRKYVGAGALMQEAMAMREQDLMARLRAWGQVGDVPPKGGLPVDLRVMLRRKLYAEMAPIAKAERVQDLKRKRRRIERDQWYDTQWDALRPRGQKKDRRYGMDLHTQRLELDAMIDDLEGHDMT